MGHRHEGWEGEDGEGISHPQPHPKMLQNLKLSLDRHRIDNSVIIIQSVLYNFTNNSISLPPPFPNLSLNGRIYENAKG